MGTFDMDISGELQKLFSDLQNVENIEDEMINAALPTIEGAVHAGYSAHVRSGSLAGSLNIHPSRAGRDGRYGYVAPEGTDARGVRNGEKAAYMEYGTGKQASTPVVAPAVKGSEGAVLEIMQNIFDSKVGAT